MTDKKKTSTKSTAKDKIAAAKRKAIKKSNTPGKAKENPAPQKADGNSGTLGHPTEKAGKNSSAPRPFKKDGIWFDADGLEITHQGTINLLENKKPWKKGQSGNPAGYKKGVKNRSTVLRELLELKLRDSKGKFIANPLDPSEENISVEKAIMAALIKKAMKGDVAAIREVQDTLFGKLKDRAEVNILPTVIRDDIPDAD